MTLIAGVIMTKFFLINDKEQMETTLGGKISFINSCVDVLRDDLVPVVLRASTAVKSVDWMNLKENPIHLNPPHNSLKSTPRLFPYSIGPLSLSSPPWKFLQSSTPLYYLEGKVAVVVVGPSMGSFNLGLNLIKERSSEARVGNVTNVVDWKELEKGDVRGGGGGGFKESFVNLPNLISMSRLVSGPFLGWYVSYL
ncbi:hypothetical protein GIB67_021030 [Kingdonia uniflora]|uniref:Uncharacterized protein n=1 Tax=Kingdonia uniflora TaxID=39325 RepID=A0A7J7N6P2_9MAGN|nr:hypothetical protein GIB67_021030 [Kingdonia uniflora]